MKVCSNCLKCYDDSDAICDVKQCQGSVTDVGHGSLKVIKGYRIESRLESASPVELYKATQTASKESVNIRFFGDDDSLKDTELNALVRTDHPNIARVYKFGRTAKNELFTVEEDITQQNLRSHLDKKSPLSEAEAIRIIRQTAQALEALHANEIVHGSINPFNIYLADSDGDERSVKLRKFNIAGLEQGASYFAPEQFAGEEVGFRSDIYSLALVFYETLIGSLPYERVKDNSHSDYFFSESEVWHLHVDLRALIAHVFRQSFQKRPELRPMDIGNVVRQLRQMEVIARRVSKSEGVFAVNRDLESDVLEQVAPQTVEEEVSAKSSNQPDTPEPAILESKSEGAIFLGTIDDVEIDDGLPVVSSVQKQSIFAEVPIGPGMLSQPANRSAPGSIPASKISKAFLYAGGMLVSAVFGGFVALNVFEWDAATASTSPNGTPDIRTEKKQPPKPAESPEVAMKDSADGDPAAADEEFENARNLRQVVEAETFESSFNENPAKDVSNLRPFEKPKAKVRSKRRPVRKSKRQTAPKEELPPRPGYFKDIIIYY